MNDRSYVYVAGHNGLVGRAVVRRLRDAGYENLLLRSRAQLDLRDQAATSAFFRSTTPQYVILAAAKAGGIGANSAYPADFIRDNLLIQCNVIDASYRCGTRKLLFLGSSCIYPRLAPQPLAESSLLTGPLEPTNEWYAIAKIAGLKMCQAYRRQYDFNAIAAMPTNLYGPDDNFDLASSHVLPALLRKVHEAKEQGRDSVTVWGTGAPLREFLHVDDFADACLFLMRHYDSEELINVGWGEDISIHDLVRMIAEVVGYAGRFEFDASKPDGTPRKLLDVRRLAALGWSPRIRLRDGIADTYRWFLQNSASATAASEVRR